VSVDALKEAIAHKQVVVVTGTGVSAALSGGAKTATWLGLLEDGVARIEAIDGNRGAFLRMRLEAYTNAPAHEKRLSDLTNLATELKQEFDAHDINSFNRWLNVAIGQLPLEHKDLAYNIEALAAPIFTTNYDLLLERALGRSSSSWRHPDVMRNIATHSNPAIGHLHGLHEDSGSVIFTNADYSKVISDPAAQALQNAAFTMKTFLFIGFGSGTDDPNFKLMIDNFGAMFSGTTAAHFRLCLTGDAQPGSSLASVVDVPYGHKHEDLPAFLESLKPDTSVRALVDKRTRSFDDLLVRARDNSTLWREADAVEGKTFAELVVPPIFLPEPHDQYATESVLDGESKKASPLDPNKIFTSSGIVLIAGEENAGVSTAVLWALNLYLQTDKKVHTHYIDDPLINGPAPVTKKLQRLYRTWGVDPIPDAMLADAAIGIDNLRYETSDKFERAIADIAALGVRTTFIGVRQQDAIDVANALSKAGAPSVSIAYLGRFSDMEAQELARRVSPGSESRLVTAVMVVIRAKRLPRNPFTITLLIELIRNGSNLKDQESEIAVLDKYMDLLLIGDHIRSDARDELTLRNKRVVLVAIARKFVEAKEDKAEQSEVLTWIQALFTELGWPYNALGCVNDLIRRRVLSAGPANTIGFQRSAYLELMAGIAAQEDIGFRNIVFSAPLELASIVRTYAAMSRNDSDLLELMEKELSRVEFTPPSGTVFGRVRQSKAPSTLFSDSGESSEDGEADPPEAGPNIDIEAYYDNRSDRDAPAFLTARIEDLPPGRVAMLLADLASRVLRDTDEIRDQELKARVLQKVLTSWVRFTDLYENDLKMHPDLDASIRSLFQEPEKEEMSDSEVASLRAMVLRIAPSYLTLSGISYCLAGPSLIPLLDKLDIDSIPDGEHAGVVRILALYVSGSTSWVHALAKLSTEASKSWISAVFLSSLARYAYISDRKLNDSDRIAIRDFLRHTIGLRYEFSGLSAKNKAMNAFEDELRKAQLKESRRPTRSISVLG